jgi:hypothetical protein
VAVVMTVAVLILVGGFVDNRGFGSSDYSHELSPTATRKPLRRHAENARSGLSLDKRATPRKDETPPAIKPGVLRVDDS